MRSSTLVTSLAAAMAPLGVSAWAQDPESGVWRANNKVYDQVGGFPSVHEACTVKDTQTVLWDKQLCDYWTDGNGGIEGGHCTYTGQAVICKSGCPNPTSSCEYVDDGGVCKRGVEGCIKKWGCGGGGDPGEYDCIAIAAGCATKCGG